MKHILRKFLTITTIFIATYIIFYLINERQSLLNFKENENFALLSTENSQFDEFKNKFKNKPIYIKNYSGDFNLPLKEYIIKSSYNTAVTGNYVSNDMIKLVLSRGCRFIDFEIFIIDDVPHVSYSKDNTYTTRDTDNTIVLDSALSTVASNAFVNSIPNPKDPIFIHLRVKSNDPKSLKYIAATIDSTLFKTGRLYKNKINKNTTLGDVAGKFVVLIDNSNINNYKALTLCTKNETACYNLDNYINSKSNNEFYTKKKYIDVFDSTINKAIVDDNTGRTNIQKITIALPDTSSTTTSIFSSDNVENPDIRELIFRYSIQISGFKYYNHDDGLLENEDFFDFFKSGIVPFKRAIPYLNKYYDE